MEENWNKTKEVETSSNTKSISFISKVLSTKSYTKKNNENYSSKKSCCKHTTTEKIDDVFQKEKINDIWEMWDKLQNETLPADYIMSELTPLDIDNFVISIRTEELNIENGLPVIKLNLTIYSDLHYKMHVCNTEIPSSKASKLTKQKWYLWKHNRGFEHIGSPKDINC